MIDEKRGGVVVCSTLIISLCLRVFELERLGDDRIGVEELGDDGMELIKELGRSTFVYFICSVSGTSERRKWVVVVIHFAFVNIRKLNVSLFCGRL